VNKIFILYNQQDICLKRFSPFLLQQKPNSSLDFLRFDDMDVLEEEEWTKKI
jgi:hypothetical protein